MNFVPNFYSHFFFMNHHETISIFIVSQLRAIYVSIKVFGSHTCNLVFHKNPQMVVNNSLN